MRLATLVVLISLLACVPAEASSVSVGDGTLHVTALEGEANEVQIAEGVSDTGEQVLVVADWGAPLVVGAGCAEAPESGVALCPRAAVAAIAVATGQGDDTLAVESALPTVASGGPGDDTLGGFDAADRLAGGAGDDVLIGAGGADSLRGGPGDDSLFGDDGGDALDGGRGADTADAGAGPDFVRLRDRKADTAACGSGRDRVRAEVLDSLDMACERVDYGPPGQVGSLLARRGGGRFVPVPGQPGTWIDRRILPNVLQLIRRYRIRLGDCLATSGHAIRGEHPLGLACDVYPGPGGSWNLVDRLARWAEPRQDRPRWPFRWVGYDGDWNHGRGHHLHLSWAHSEGRPGRPVRTVWAWAVRRGAAGFASGPLMGPPTQPPPSYPRELGRPDY